MKVITRIRKKQRDKTRRRAISRIEKCGRECASVVAKLVRLILMKSRWPTSGEIYWVLPLYKRQFKSVPKNNRGIHLTNQLLKVVDHFIAGPCQFACTALTICVCEWIWALGHKCRSGLYYSDVVGAFDKMNN